MEDDYMAKPKTAGKQLHRNSVFSQKMNQDFIKQKQSDLNDTYQIGDPDFIDQTDDIPVTIVANKPPRENMDNLIER